MQKKCKIRMLSCHSKNIYYFKIVITLIHSILFINPSQEIESRPENFEPITRKKLFATLSF